MAEGSQEVGQVSSGMSVERRQDFLADTARKAEDLQRGELGQGRDGKRAAGKEAVRPLMVLVPRNDERGQVRWRRARDHCRAFRIPASTMRYGWLL
jgi:hypothetical protein